MQPHLRFRLVQQLVVCSSCDCGIAGPVEGHALVPVRLHGVGAACVALSQRNATW
jgi:hypothetical protein